jgi:hypothetical protein
VSEAFTRQPPRNGRISILLLIGQYGSGCSWSHQGLDRPHVLCVLSLAFPAIALGIDLSEKGTQTGIDVLRSGQKFRYVITVCSDADAKGCPLFPGVATRFHWPFRDPSQLKGSDEEKLRAIREIRDDIRARVEDWCEQVCPEQVTELIEYA